MYRFFIAKMLSRFEPETIDMKSESSFFTLPRSHWHLHWFACTLFFYLPKLAIGMEQKNRQTASANTINMIKLEWHLKLGLE